MKKSIVFLAFLAVGGTMLAGEEDETLMNLVGKYRAAAGEKKNAYNQLKAAERYASSGHKESLMAAYRAYEETTLALEQLLITHPNLATYITDGGARSMSLERSCSPEAPTFSSPCSRASSPAVPT